MVAQSTPRIDLERARQHVAEAERRIAAQRELVERMVRDHDPEAAVETARTLLRTFEETLVAMRRHLEQEVSSVKAENERGR